MVQPSAAVLPRQPVSEQVATALCLFGLDGSDTAAVTGVNMSFCLQNSPESRYLAARLMPTWRDSPEEQQQQYPALLGLTAEQASAVQQQRMPTDEPSFNDWARSLRINPTGAVENLMQAMQNMSVTNQLQQDSSISDSQYGTLQSKTTTV